MKSDVLCKQNGSWIRTVEGLQLLRGQSKAVTLKEGGCSQRQGAFDQLLDSMLKISSIVPDAESTILPNRGQALSQPDLASYHEPTVT
jgi:hypothetical protein